MINCSESVDYYANVQKLKSDLSRRGDPSLARRTMPYDSSRRMNFLKKMADRERRTSNNSDASIDMVVLKIPYAPWVRHLRLRTMFRDLKNDIQRKHGEELRNGTRFLATHPVGRSVALDTYMLNFAK